MPEKLWIKKDHHTKFQDNFNIGNIVQLKYWTFFLFLLNFLALIKTQISVACETHACSNVRITQRSQKSNFHHSGLCRVFQFP